jgi:hypothetical protein
MMLSTPCLMFFVGVFFDKTEVWTQVFTLEVLPLESLHHPNTLFKEGEKHEKAFKMMLIQFYFQTNNLHIKKLWIVKVLFCIKWNWSTLITDECLRKCFFVLQIKATLALPATKIGSFANDDVNFQLSLFKPKIYTSFLHEDTHLLCEYHKDLMLNMLGYLLNLNNEPGYKACQIPLNIYINHQLFRTIKVLYIVQQNFRLYLV